MMKLPDPCMPNSPPRDRNYFLACYAVSLAQGESLRSQIIRGSTITLYLKAARELLDTRTGCSYECDEDPLKVILKALTDYDDMAKRKNMICDDMMHWLHKFSTRFDKDSATAAIIDWIKLGRYGGFRKEEWCQSSQSKFAVIHDWPGKPTKAFTWGDLTFFDRHKRRLSHHELTETNVFYVRIRWRKQKNKDNGQEITYALDRDLPDFCPVLAALRIAQRAIRLRIPRHQPIGQGRHDKTRKRIFLTNALVTSLLRLAAQSVYHLPAGDPELDKWASHSIRVTAANLLHRERFSDSYIQTRSDSYIQTRLRWKSDSFLKYLRNTFYTAMQHTTTLRLSDYRTRIQRTGST